MRHVRYQVITQNTSHTHTRHRVTPCRWVALLPPSLSPSLSLSVCVCVCVCVCLSVTYLGSKVPHVCLERESPIQKGVPKVLHGPVDEETEAKHACRPNSIHGQALSLPCPLPSSLLPGLGSFGRGPASLLNLLNDHVAAEREPAARRSGCKH